MLDSGPQQSLLIGQNVYSKTTFKNFLTVKNNFTFYNNLSIDSFDDKMDPDRDFWVDLDPIEYGFETLLKSCLFQNLCSD